MHKQIYDEFTKDLIVETQVQASQNKPDEGPKPIIKRTDPNFKKNATDKQIWEEIEKDVKRTRQDVAFFHMALNADQNTDSERLLR